MNHLPASPDLDHLRKQARELLRDALASNPEAIHRFLTTLPLLRSISPAELATHQLKLHDAQSVVAREYGFRSWTELKRFVEFHHTGRADRIRLFCTQLCTGRPSERHLALRILREQPSFPAGDRFLACVIGDEPTLRNALAQAPAFATKPSGPLNMLPLIAVTHSSLILEPEFEPKLLACAQLLLDHHADVNATWTDPEFPDWPLSALYGATGRTHSIAMTQLLLAHHPNLDDNESLYHSIESHDSTITRLLLDAGARITNTNAIGRALDYSKIDDIRLMLERGGDGHPDRWLHHAILRGCSMELIQLLLDHGADPRAINQEGVSLSRYAHLLGRIDVVDLLRSQGIDDPLTEPEQFIAACTRADEPAARAILSRIPNLIDQLTPHQLTTLPEMAATGNLSAVRTMLAVGWPREVKMGWGATALNQAVYRGDAAMTDLLLSNGADWRTRHDFNDNVLGTLSHSSREAPEDPNAPCDFLGCAKALLAHNVPLPTDDYAFGPELTAFYDTLRLSTP